MLHPIFLLGISLLSLIYLVFYAWKVFHWSINEKLFNKIILRTLQKREIDRAIKICNSGSPKIFAGLIKKILLFAQEFPENITTEILQKFLEDEQIVLKGKQREGYIKSLLALFLSAFSIYYAHIMQFEGELYQIFLLVFASNGILILLIAWQHNRLAKSVKKGFSSFLSMSLAALFQLLNPSLYREQPHGN